MDVAPGSRWLSPLGRPLRVTSIRGDTVSCVYTSPGGIDLRTDDAHLVMTAGNLLRCCTPIRPAEPERDGWPQVVRRLKAEA